MCVPIACDAQELIDTTAILFRQSGQLTDGVDLRCHYPDDLPQILGDPNQLRQVLWNLLSNGVDATAGRGAIDIIATAMPDRRQVWIAVTDDGPGVADAKQVFEPFFTTKAHGTGLGLTVVARIVRDHGGTIRIENVAGRGARVAFTIPVADTSAHSALEMA